MKFRFKSMFVRAGYFLIDFICVYSAIAIAMLLRESAVPFDVSYFTIITDHQNPFQLVILFWILTTILVLNANRLYQTRREVLRGLEVWLVTKSVFISSLLVVVVIYGFKLQGFPRSIFLIGTLLNVIFLSLWRFFKRLFVNYLVANGYNNFNVLIVGAGKVGLLLKAEIEKHPELGLKVVGFLDDFRESDSAHPDIRILGKISHFRRIVKREFIQKVFITIHHDVDILEKILELSKAMRIGVRVIPHGFDLSAGEFAKFNIGVVPVLEYLDFLPKTKQVGKRLFDFFVSFFSILILSPIIFGLAVIIKLTSRGPVFYRSLRYGYNGKKFDMFKFRSMVVDADEIKKNLHQKNEADGPIFKIKKDPRITPIGRFLRKYSLDELPQLFNVLKGDMSLVGPRPLPIEQVEKEDFKQLKRLEVRPGITGLWQIKGRSDISFARLVKWDTWYINNWSFWLDINILFQTIPVVLKGKGAY